MSHLHRFYSESLDADASTVELSGEEAHHAVRVVRLRPGDAVSLFDGKGLEVIGSYEGGTKHAASVRVIRAVRHVPPQVRVTLAVGGLHRDKPQEEVVRRATELGACRVYFWDGDHSQRPVKHSDRWRKTAVEACKQCGRFFLPVVDTVSSLDAFLDSLAGPVVMAALSEKADAAPAVNATDRLALLIGPEGDFSDRELALALEVGAIPVSLGKHVYRSEVAASLLLTIVAHTLGELGPALHIIVE